MRPVRTIIFAKEPRPGLAKTRLIPALGQEGSAALAERLIRRTLCAVEQARLGPIELCVAPDRSNPYWATYELRAELTEQVTGDLGDRLYCASKRGIDLGTPVLLIGTDCPDLTATRLIEFAKSLDRHPACLCPVIDGGYALLGLNQSLPSLFASIPWSTDQVAERTRERFRALGWTWYESEPLWDLDLPEDLRRLRDEHQPLLTGSDSELKSSG